MTVRVIPEASKFTDRNGTVVVEAATQEAVLSPAARQAAIQFAGTQGLTKVGTSGGEAAYPVNAQGETSDDLIFARNGQTVAGYRCDYKVTAGM